VSALKAIPSQFSKNELAYLALTSKPEARIRDALAWGLYESAPEGYLVTREYSEGSLRYDLGIVDASNGQNHPTAFLEAKLHFTFDFSEGVSDRLKKVIFSDITKLEKRVGASCLGSEESTFFLHVLVTPLAPIGPEVLDIVKYQTRINRSFRRSADAGQVRRRALAQLDDFYGRQIEGELHKIDFLAGEAFGIPVAFDLLLVVGPKARP